MRCEAEVRLYDRLFNDPNPDAGGKNFLEALQPGFQEAWSSAYLEPGLRDAKPEDRFQFERHGYFVADRIDSQPGQARLQPHGWPERQLGQVTMTTQTIKFPLEGEFIALNDLLKLAGVCDSGGAGKALVAAGEVSVDGAAESRKTAKIRAGQVVDHGRRAHQGGGRLI